jgi:hypothetical protein
MSNEPHAKRCGCLKNGNPPGNPQTAPRCRAKTRKGTSCQAPAMSNGRCRMHGGKSTGPRTPEGLAHSRKANWKHGLYSLQEKEERRQVRVALRILRYFGVFPRAVTKRGFCCFCIACSSCQASTRLIATASTSSLIPSCSRKLSKLEPLWSIVLRFFLTLIALHPSFQSQLMLALVSPRQL